MLLISFGDPDFFHIQCYAMYLFGFVTNSCKIPLLTGQHHLFAQCNTMVNLGTDQNCIVTVHVLACKC